MPPARAFANWLVHIITELQFGHRYAALAEQKALCASRPLQAGATPSTNFNSVGLRRQADAQGMHHPWHLCQLLLAICDRFDNQKKVEEKIGYELRFSSFLQSALTKNKVRAHQRLRPQQELPVSPVIRVNNPDRASGSDWRRTPPDNLYRAGASTLSSCL